MLILWMQACRSFIEWNLGVAAVNHLASVNTLGTFFGGGGGISLYL